MPLLSLGLRHLVIRGSSSALDLTAAGNKLLQQAASAAYRVATLQDCCLWRRRDRTGTATPERARCGVGRTGALPHVSCANSHSVELHTWMETVVAMHLICGLPRSEPTSPVVGCRLNVGTDPTNTLKAVVR
ncbi:hypothetical protein P154DRAFT_595853 [Amniculicola lignicola CBS 123094]|uniref:Uncharacterized protein n=1 Tax=Amniculicola lignicola CBS 123094 TaxID=1392246 RepID=A0A6A5WIU7_9PLEO|nr:hypothetical protein P154DRAFT_595853 [Amniculicola lignicola CBS 123094]